MADYLVIETDDWHGCVKFHVKRNANQCEVEEFCDDLQDNHNSISATEITWDLLRQIESLAKDLGVKTK